jgi:hypothetical protein
MAATNGNSATEVIGVLKAAIKNQTLSGALISSTLSFFVRSFSAAILRFFSERLLSLTVPRL